MRPLDLDDLPRYTPWLHRLLGLETFDQKVRTVEQIENEYNADKFKRCLDLYEESGGTLSPFELRMKIDRIALDEEADAVVDGALVLATLREINDRRNVLMRDALADAAARGDTILELGSAFGFNLDYLAGELEGARFFGADYSRNAIALAGKLFDGDDRFAFDTFNFYDERYAVFDKIEGPVTVLTAQAIEQTPSAAPLIAALKRDRERISEVVQIEPDHTAHDPATTTGALRKRYGVLNDYNRDLVSLLESDPDVELLEKSTNIIGFNAFNPLTRLRWRFR